MKTYFLQYPDGRLEKIQSYQHATKIKEALRFQKGFNNNGTPVKFEEGMAVIFEEQKPSKAGKQFCGICEQGWVVVTDNGDPMYPNHQLMVPCKCNASANAQLEEEHKQNMNLPHYRSSFEAETIRRVEHREFLRTGVHPKPSENPLLAALEARKHHNMNFMQAKIRLAEKLHPKGTVTKNLEFWEAFDKEHPDPIEELEKLEGKAVIKEMNN